MTIKRYGTSSMPVENGIYVLHKDYEALEAERDSLLADRDRWEEQLTEALMNCAVTAVGAKMIFDEIESLRSQEKEQS